MVSRWHSASPAVGREVVWASSSGTLVIGLAFVSRRANHLHAAPGAGKGPPAHRAGGGRLSAETEKRIGLLESVVDTSSVVAAAITRKQCVGQDLNLRTPTGQRPQRCAFDQAGPPTRNCDDCRDRYKTLARAAPPDPPRAGNHPCNEDAEGEIRTPEGFRPHALKACAFVRAWLPQRADHPSEAIERFQH